MILNIVQILMMKKVNVKLFTFVLNKTIFGEILAKLFSIKLQSQLQMGAYRAIMVLFLHMAKLEQGRHSLSKDLLLILKVIKLLIT